MSKLQSRGGKGRTSKTKKEPRSKRARRSGFAHYVEPSLVGEAKTTEVIDPEQRSLSELMTKLGAEYKHVQNEGRWCLETKELAYKEEVAT